MIEIFSGCVGMDTTCKNTGDLDKLTWKCPMTGVSKLRLAKPFRSTHEAISSARNDVLSKMKK